MRPWRRMREPTRYGKSGIQLNAVTFRPYRPVAMPSMNRWCPPFCRRRHHPRFERPLSRMASDGSVPQAAGGTFQAERPHHSGSCSSRISPRNRRPAKAVTRGWCPENTTRSRPNDCIRGPRRSCLRSTALPSWSAPWIWNTFFARSIQIVVTCMVGAPSGSSGCWKFDQRSELDLELWGGRTITLVGRLVDQPLGGQFNIRRRMRGQEIEDFLCFFFVHGACRSAVGRSLY
jgi:hypothetical protein